MLVAWRLRDMWPKLENFLREMEILPALETRQNAAATCVAHRMHIEGRNNPVRFFYLLSFACYFIALYYMGTPVQ